MTIQSVKKDVTRAMLSAAIRKAAKAIGLSVSDEIFEQLIDATWERLGEKKGGE